ncbi:MAG: FkbM family methyltransferase [Bacteroidia bacterium]|nr:FkbM family methyltransferase [Bacteroidia bacterium]MDW8332809.1 FkbM family methyltransferase [Bacteroidia bacterium]
MITRIFHALRRRLFPDPLTRLKTIHFEGVERFGTDYGGWSVCTPLIRRDSVVYSFGIGTDVSFDLGLIERFGVTVHAFDPTPASIEWVKKFHDRPDLKVYPYGLADFNGSRTFYPPDNPDHISHTIVPKTTSSAPAFEVEFKTLDAIMRELGHDSIDVLKMDIEGAEYGVVDDLTNKKIFPKQLLVEYHHDMYPGLTKPNTLDSIGKLRRAGYQLFHVSPTLREFHFIRQTK